MGRSGDLKRTDVVLSAVGSMLLWLVTLAIDPFGVVSAADASSRVLYQRVLAPFYPTDNQSSIAVVLIRDDDVPLIEDGHAAWPPKFSEYAAILRNLTGRDGARPEAIFVDLLLDNQHNDDETLKDLCAAIEEAEAHGIPVLFAEIPAPAGREATSLAVSKCGTRVRLGAAGWISRDGDYPLTVELRDRRTLTAAAALYRNHLDVADDEAGLRRFDHEVQSGAAVSVQWGASPPADDPECVSVGETLAERISASFRIAIAGSGLFGSDRGLFNQVQPCLFHRVYAGRSIARAGAFERIGIAQELERTIIFVGAQIDGIPDILESPVHGVAPGVFEHAMALDNLMSFGAQFYRHAPELRAGSFSAPSDAFFVAILILVLAAYLRSVDGPRLYARTRAGLAMAFAHKVTIAVLFTALIALFIGLSHFGLRYEPFNWGSVASIGMIMIFSRRFRRSEHPEATGGS